jgi:hypothetical protein
MKMLTADLVKLDDNGAPWSSREIARKCAISHDFVARLKSSLSSDDSDSGPPGAVAYTTKHGTVAKMNTAAIGKRSAPALALTDGSTNHNLCALPSGRMNTR